MRNAGSLTLGAFFRRLHSTLVYSAVAVLVFVAAADLARAETENSVPVTTVSGASFLAPVAPDSLASIFGTQLSKNVVYAQLDSRGQLPTQLDGTTVEINGRAAPLIFASPSQINFLIPADTEIGSANVVVKSSATGFVSRGTVPVSTVAPAIFSVDSSGRGRGAILNAVTNTLDPFAVNTQENQGSDKRTRVAIYATGLRYAGNAGRDSAKVNVYDRVLFEGTDAAGKVWNLPVEYAGPAPGFFGLDQVNALLPAELDGAGVLGVTILAESAISNRVTITVRDSRGPAIISVSPLSAAPGSEIVIHGERFAPPVGGEGASRTVAVFDAGSGREMSAVPTSVTPDDLRVLLPPLASGPTADWYQGPMKVCVQVDQQRTCHSQLLNVQQAVKPAGLPGQLLVNTSQQILQSTITALQTVGNTQQAQALQSEGAITTQFLADAVRDAVAGQPRSFSFQDDDGSTKTVVLDLATLNQVESLMAANQANVNAAIANFRGLALRPLATSTNCGLPEEKRLEERQKYHRVFGQLEMTATLAGLGASITLALSGGGYLVNAAVGVLWTLATWPLVYGQIDIEYSPELNIIQSVRVEPASLDVPVGNSKNFAVKGTFSAISAETRNEELIYGKYLGMVLAIIPGGAASPSR